MSAFILGPEDDPSEAPLDETTPPIDEQFGEDLSPGSHERT
jgi:hypothetical protein